MKECDRGPLPPGVMSKGSRICLGGADRAGGGSTGAGCGGGCLGLRGAGPGGNFAHFEI